MAPGIGIFGLGYFGLTAAACLVERNFRVVGYEVSDEKRAQLLAGRCPLSEPGVEPALLGALERGAFSVARDLRTGGPPDLAFVCVGTPNLPDGSTDLRAVRGVFAQFAEIAAGRGADLDTEIVLRSTVPPGTLTALRDEFPALFARVPVVFYPEFLREGTAMKDFLQPPQTVLGVLRGAPAPVRLPSLLAALGFEYELVDSVSAETLKFACNAFHALKVAFANEVGRVAAAAGGDGTEILRLFVRDTALNISPRYLLPGNPYGGSCLPKDTRAFQALGRARGVPLPLLQGCEASNAAHLEFIVARVAARRPRLVTVLGLAFKKDTDDVRESAGLALVRRLAGGQGLAVHVHDFLVQPDRVVGVNQQALEALLALPGVTFCPTLEGACAGSDLLVVMQHDRRYHALNHGTPVMDVARWQGM